ncbi:uncharacterized protein LOC131209547 [Anopheles bellator]|uniref:uncharacterized protein LOC131209547 n=1 Tax=Anopheles bellator TaxID=139047 RepID=UPI0026477DB8|nr:uncharacterized protein LOC131209547 [Anopheles bellator]
MSSVAQSILSNFKSFGWRGKLLTTVGVLLTVEISYELCLYVQRMLRRRKSQRHFCNVFFMNRRLPENVLSDPALIVTENIARLVNYIDRAQDSICLSLYIFTLADVRDAVIRAKKERGVAVRAVTCESMIYNGGAQFIALLNEGITVHYKIKADHLMHHKFCLLDAEWLCANCLIAEHIQQTGQPSKDMQYALFDRAVQTERKTLEALFGSACTKCDATKRNAREKRLKSSENPLQPGGVLITGSSNWTMPALTVHWENMIFTSYPELVRPFAVEFQRLWYELGDDMRASKHLALQNGKSLVKSKFASNEEHNVSIV